MEETPKAFFFFLVHVISAAARVRAHRHLRLWDVVA